MLPDCWQVSVLIGEVEEGCEIFNAQWSQMLELVDCESICTGGSGVFAEADSGVNLSGRRLSGLKEIVYGLDG